MSLLMLSRTVSGIGKKRTKDHYTHTLSRDNDYRMPLTHDCFQRVSNLMSRL